MVRLRIRQRLRAESRLLNILFFSNCNEPFHIFMTGLLLCLVCMCYDEDVFKLNY